jgi:hypothetical protein
VQYPIPCPPVEAINPHLPYEQYPTPQSDSLYGIMLVQACVDVPQAQLPFNCIRQLCPVGQVPPHVGEDKNPPCLSQV